MGVPFVPKYVRPTIIVFDEDNRILLVRYCEDERWDVPGGCMEVGESVEESARRELLEETGLIAQEMKLETILIYKEILAIVYVTTKFTGNPCPDGIETNDARFFSLTDLPQNMDPFIRQALLQFAAK